MKCVIIASGDLDLTFRIRQIIKTAQILICADGGARHLRMLDILPHVLIGDFDSIHADDKAFLKTKNVKQIKFPAKKDQTDSELCVLWAMEHKATDITLLGVLGSRLDHSLANIFLLKKLAEQNIPARIIDKNNELIMVCDSIELEGNPGDLLSIIPVTDKVTGITLKGLEYPMENGQIEMGSSIGISNHFVQNRATISIQTGRLIVATSKD
ncbi:MAG: thiamine diphosphokinase [Pseudomonadota bacterium]